jgi:hypothetical protein
MDALIVGPEARWYDPLEMRGMRQPNDARLHDRAASAA